MPSTKSLGIRFTDQLIESVRQNHEQRITELQTAPTAAWRCLGDFTIPNAGQVLVEHGLGREPLQVLLSPPRVDIGVVGITLTVGGILFEVTSAGVDRSRVLDLRASGYGTSVIVTVSVL